MTQKRIKEIRELLERFYTGATLPEEERQLAEMLKEAEGLPTDLEADCRLFVSLSADMPDEVSERIERALDTEMAKERRRFATRSRRWYIAGAAAVCFLILAIGVGLLLPERDSTDQDRQMQYALVKTNGKNVKVPTPELPECDSLIMNPIAQSVTRPAKSEKLPQRGEKIEQSAPRAERLSTTKPNISDREAPVVTMEASSESYPDDPYGYIASNYRIIDDPREAEALVGELIAIMESNLMIEQSRVIGVYDNLQLELTNCCAQLQ
ncbi:MAG: hypothetical protein K2G67_06730 [Muribaculaceae bacterium]|nr:hypothetical protein [Muribaculaceae bacterium]